MKRFFRWSCFLGLTIFPTATFSQTNTPKHSNEFLSIGVGARSLGMSNAQVSIADNVTAGFWNPAGLLDIESKYEFELMHASLFAGIANFDYAGPMTETILLGNVALLTGRKIEWDAANMQVTNVPEANQYIRRQYREGWTL